MYGDLDQKIYVFDVAGFRLTDCSAFNVGVSTFVMNLNVYAVDVAGCTLNFDWFCFF